MESYSVQAVLSAVDKNFSKTFASANKTANSFGNNTEKSTRAGGNSMIKFGAVAGAATAVVSKALSVVKNNIGSAVDRFDTLNKYPVVMKALGYSTKDTGKSMKLLSNGIDGLPTSLNEITSAAQQFAPLTGGATSGAKAALALNDAFLASGASVADTSRGMQQYTQMLATGKVDMQSWRTLQETMPIALRKTAKAFGFTGKSAEQDLFKALQSGQITIDDLNKKFVELDKGQNGFSKLARKNSVGIRTSFTNLGTAVTKGLAGTLTAINDGLKNAKLGGIADLINNMKGGINTAFNAINSTITKYIPIIVNAIKTMVDFVKKNKGWIMPLTAGMSGFVAAFVAMNKVISIVKSVGSAMSGLFSILTANPFVLVIALIAALAAGLYYFFTQTKTGKKLWESFSKAVGGSGNAIKIAGLAVVALGAGLLGLVLAFKKPLGMLKQFTGSTKTVGSLAGKTGGQLAGMGAKAAGIGIGIGAAAAGIGVFAMGVAKLAATGMQGVIALAAMTASIVILAATFAILQGPLTAAIPAMLSLSVTMLSAGAAALMIGGAIALAGVGIDLAGQGVMRLVQAFILLGTNMNMIIPLLTILGAGFAAMVTSFLTSVISAMPVITAAFLGMFLGILTQLTTYVPLLVAQFSQILIGFITALTTYIPQIAIAITNMLVAMMNAVATNAPLLIATFTNMVVSIINALTAALPQFITAGTNFIVSLLQGVASNIGRVVSAAVDVVVAFINGIASNLGKIINAGLNLLGKFIMGIVNAIPKLASTAMQAVQKFVYGVGNALGQVLGSGHKLLSMLVQGIVDGYGKVTKAGQGSGKAGADGARGTQGLFQSAGSFIGQGLVNGIKSMAGSAMSAAASIASQAAGAIKKALKIHSPSRVTYGFGGYFGAGFINGIKSTQKQVGRVAGGMGDLASNALNSNIQALNANVTGSYNGSLTMQDSSLQMQNNALLRTIAGKNTDLYLDGNTLVGGTANRMDNALGNNTRLRGRLS